MERTQAVQLLHLSKLLDDVVQTMRNVAQGSFDTELGAVSEAVSELSFSDNWPEVVAPNDKLVEPLVPSDLDENDVAVAINKLYTPAEPEPLFLTFKLDRGCKTKSRWTCVYWPEEFETMETLIDQTKTGTKDVVVDMLDFVKCHVETSL